jgi:stearoyl-CoA desaturase (delta-9 desaturase)
VKRTNFDPTKWTIWTLEKLGLVSDLRRVPDEKILLAEMTETKRRAEERIHAIQATHGYCQRTAEMLTQLSEKLAANYHELEQAVSDRVQLSREALQNWQDETRALMRQISQLAKPALV